MKAVKFSSDQLLKYSQNVSNASSDSESTCLVSSDIILKRNKEFGLHVIATHKLNPGDIILVEKAFALHTSVQPNSSYCYHCAIRCSNVVNCTGCAKATFCSDKCFNEAFKKYHETECKMMDLLSSEPLASDFAIPFIFKIFLIICQQGQLLEQVKEKWTNYSDEKKLKDVTEEAKEYKINGDIIKIIVNMYRQFPSNQMIEKRSKTYYSLINGLKRNTTFFSNITEENANEIEKFVSMLMLNLETAFQYNTFNISEQLIDRESLIRSIKSPFEKHEMDGTSSKVASGFYRVANSFNHSCASNAMYSFHRGNVIVFRALHTIDEGQQICASYGARHTLHSFTERGGLLPFKCFCVACKNDWPILSNMLTLSKFHCFHNEHNEHTAISVNSMIESCDDCREKYNKMENMLCNLMQLKNYFMKLKLNDGVTKLYIDTIICYEKLGFDNILLYKEFALLLQFFDRHLSFCGNTYVKS